MTQTLYAHINKIKVLKKSSILKKKDKKRSHAFLKIKKN
jgi:hypothetical protein